MTPVLEASSFQLKYELTGQGWAACHIMVNDQSVTATASYISDALGDLITAVLLLKKTGHAPDAIFAEEPGQFRWTMEYHEANNENRSHVLFGLYFQEKWIGPRRSLNGDLGDKRLTALIPADLFFHAFDEMLNDILITYGTEGYAEMWNGDTITMPFPSREHEELKSSL